jgi:hypothetical protein
VLHRLVGHPVTEKQKLFSNLLINLKNRYGGSREIMQAKADSRRPGHEKTKTNFRGVGVSSVCLANLLALPTYALLLKNI